MPRWLADLRHGRSVRYLGGAFLGSAALALLAGFIILAYQLIAARVPEHRAALERLVRAQTGLDLRFEELGLRWGWYGPEAVFSRVELGEPGRANVLLRAPELIVAFDAWSTVQSGRLQAGRITLIAPEIDLPRYLPAAAERTAAPAAAPGAGTAAILERWRGGRIDFEGGTVHLPDPNDSCLLYTSRTALAAAALIEEHDAVAPRVEKAPHLRLGTAARAAVQKHCGRSLRVAALLEIDLMQLAHAQEAGLVGRQMRIELLQPAFRDRLLRTRCTRHDIGLASIGPSGLPPRRCTCR